MRGEGEGESEGESEGEGEGKGHDPPPPPPPPPGPAPTILTTAPPTAPPTAPHPHQPATLPKVGVKERGNGDEKGVVVALPGSPGTMVVSRVTRQFL